MTAKYGPTLPPLEVIDFRVAIYNLLPTYKSIRAAHPGTARNWLTAAWAIYLNRGPTCQPYEPRTVVVADDSPPYWRADYVANHYRDLGIEGPAYKGGRPTKEPEWFEVEEAGKSYLTQPGSPFRWLRIPGYEADDLAGAIVRATEGLGRRVYLHTVDTDWLGLVSERVTWFNMGPWTPRKRGPLEALRWAYKTWEIIALKPSDIWWLKQAYGDSSDNLLPGSPIEVISLLEPPSQYDPLKTHPGLIEQVALTKATASASHLQQAEAWFRNHHLDPPMYGYRGNPYQRFG